MKPPNGCAAAFAENPESAHACGTFGLRRRSTQPSSGVGLALYSRRDVSQSVVRISPNHGDQLCTPSQSDST
jgi:hypothetical protein